MRPAINVGLSVSRVGRSAQSKAMRAVSGSLRLEVAQYREMAVFAQFGADIDDATANMLRNGERMMELLGRSRTVFLLSDQVAILYAVSSGVFKPYAGTTSTGRGPKLLRYLHDNESGPDGRHRAHGTAYGRGQNPICAGLLRICRRKRGAAWQIRMRSATHIARWSRRKKTGAWRWSHRRG
jgi:hypothetical protein